MIDLKTVQSELDAARHARLAAEAASCDVEDFIHQVQHFRPGHSLVFMVEGEPEPLAH